LNSDPLPLLLLLQLIRVSVTPFSFAVDVDVDVDADADDDIDADVSHFVDGNIGNASVVDPVNALLLLLLALKVQVEGMSDEVILKLQHKNKRIII